MIYHYNQPLSNRSSPAVYFFYVPLVSYKSFSVGYKKHNQTTCCSVMHGQCHLKLLKWYFTQLSSTGIGVKMLLWDYWANASHIESAASYETSLGSLPISTPLAYFCMKQILMIIIGQMKASPKSEILACRNGKMHVSAGIVSYWRLFVDKWQECCMLSDREDDKKDLKKGEHRESLLFIHRCVQTHTSHHTLKRRHAHIYLHSYSIYVYMPTILYDLIKKYRL